MTGSATKRMISAYNQRGAAPQMFLAGLFQSPAQNFYNTEEVELDIQRGTEEVSIVVQDLSTGYRFNAEDRYTNKSFKAPIHKEAVPINSWDLLKRDFGENPFASKDFRANVITRAFTAVRKVEDKIRRAIELQASQVMQTGRLVLVDSNGAPLYELDFKPKASHFPTAANAWGGAGATILSDIEALAEQIRADGLGDPDQLILGSKAYAALISDPAIIAQLDTRRIEVGGIGPMQVQGNGATYRGRLDIGSYQYMIYTYAGKYRDPVDGTLKDYMDPGKVIVRDSSGRLDATFGAIPNIGKILGAQPMNLLPEMPNRLSNVGGGMDLHTNVWLSPDGEQLFVGVGARPLLIPTAIDSYGAIDVGL